MKREREEREERVNREGEREERVDREGRERGERTERNGAIIILLTNVVIYIYSKQITSHTQPTHDQPICCNMGSKGDTMGTHLILAQQRPIGFD